MSARIVVDPDGTRWVSVDITEEQFRVLQAHGALDALSREVWRAVGFHNARQMDADIMAMVGEPLAECAHCHAPLLATDAVDETGTMHAEPCAGEDRQAQEDRIVDREREREWADAAADTDSDTATSEGGTE